jgi:hypothetical protein
MAHSLHPPSIRDTPCFHCSSLYILGGLSRHVKGAHPLASLVSHATQAILSLQMSSHHVFILSSIPLASWG